MRTDDFLQGENDRDDEFSWEIWNGEMYPTTYFVIEVVKVSIRRKQTLCQISIKVPAPIK